MLLRARRFQRGLHSSAPVLARVLIGDAIHPKVEQILQDAGHEVTMPYEGMDVSKELGNGYDALLVRSGIKVTAGVMDAGLPTLKLIGRAGVGVDNIDIPEATRRGIMVMNTPGSNTTSTAELSMSMLLGLARNIPAATSSLKEGRWERKKFTGTEVYGKTLGIVGLGRIGRALGHMAQAFGMKIIGYDPIVAPDAAEQHGIESVSLDEIFERSDFISLHTPQTPETSKMINAKTLAKCKAGVRIVNCARGGLVNEEELLAALESGHVAGAALDVFASEPPTEASLRLASHPNVVCTPHLGASTAEAQVTVAVDIAQQVADALGRGRYRGVVNAAASDVAARPDLAPLLAISDRMGALHAQLLQSGETARRIEVTVQGAKGQDRAVAAAVTSSAVQGFLQAMLREEAVNFVNAPVLARERGIEVLERIEPKAREFENLVTVAIETKSQRMELSGTFFGGEPRLVRLGDSRLDICPRGTMLVISNEDRAGVLQGVTRVLGQEGINIADVALSRSASGAMGVFALDGEPSEEALREIEKVPYIHSTRVVHLPDGTYHHDGEGDVEHFKQVRPGTRPRNPNFGSGPTSKRPGWTLASLVDAPLGRSHRSSVGKAKLAEAIDRTRRLLDVPDDFHVGILPGSDTGAFESALWTLLRPDTPVDVLHWESFGKGWYTDIQKHLKHPNVTSHAADYGLLPDLSKVNWDNDVVLTWNGTTSGVCMPSPDSIPVHADRKGLALVDATSAVFAQNVPVDRCDALTFSWQKVLGGEAAHGVTILSPRAVERAEANSADPAWPVPKVFRITDKNHKLNAGIFRGATINTPSMLAVEDYIDSLKWAEAEGGLRGLCKRADTNFAVLQEFVEQNNDWISFLAQEPTTRSNTSVCLKLKLPDDAVKRVAKLLEAEGVAYDIGAYRDAPPGLRIWCGATVEADDLRSLTRWITWAKDVVSDQ